MYPEFKQSVLGRPILSVQGITNPYGVECVTLGWDYAATLWPGVSIKNTITLGNANTVFANANATYFEKVVNDHNDVNQLSPQGAILCFGGTPAPGYTNQFINPDGHLGICDSANSSGYTLLQQNAPNAGQAVNLTTYPWKFRPCQGWLIPISSTPPPAPVIPPAAQTVHLPADIATWAAYRVGSLLRKGTTDQVGTLRPSEFGGLSYQIVSWVGNYAVNVDTDDFGEVTLWVRDTPAVIS